MTITDGVSLTAVGLSRIVSAVRLVLVSAAIMFVCLGVFLVGHAFGHAAAFHGVTHCDGTVTWTATNDYQLDAVIVIQGQQNENLPANGSVSFDGPDTIKTKVTWSDHFKQPSEGFQTWNAAPSHDCETTTTVPVTTVPETTVPQTTVPVTTVPRTTVPVTHPPTTKPPTATTVKPRVESFQCTQANVNTPECRPLPATGFRSRVLWIGAFLVVIGGVVILFTSPAGDAIGRRVYVVRNRFRR